MSIRESERSDAGEKIVEESDRIGMVKKNQPTKTSRDGVQRKGGV